MRSAGNYFHEQLTLGNVIEFECKVLLLINNGLIMLLTFVNAGSIFLLFLLVIQFYVENVL